jgi:hypothetical protein
MVVIDGGIKQGTSEAEEKILPWMRADKAKLRTAAIEIR